MTRIRELRNAQGWRQVDLAEKLHIKKNTVSRYETGSLGVDATTICTLCDLFDCSADYLLCQTEIKKPVLTDDEFRLVEAFRDADPDLQDLILRNLKINNSEKKKAIS